MSITAQGIGIVATGQYAYKGAMASAPTASRYPLGTHAFFTDVGLNGTDMVVSASGTWIPHNGRALLSRLTLPVVKAPTIPADASGTANGAITFGTAVGTAFAKCYCYFAANVVNAAQPAGFYYMEMSTTTAATVYNNLYTPAAGTYPTEPTSKTAFSGAVPGGAGSTAEITAFIYTLNGGLLGNFGSKISDLTIENNSSATTKSVRAYLDGVQIAGFGITTASTTLESKATCKNQGSESKQRTSSFGAIRVTTVDTSASKNCSFSFQSSAAATDWCALSIVNISVEVA